MLKKNNSNITILSISKNYNYKLCVFTIHRFHNNLMVGVLFESLHILLSHEIIISPEIISLKNDYKCFVFQLSINKDSTYRQSR